MVWKEEKIIQIRTGKLQDHPKQRLQLRKAWAVSSDGSDVFDSFVFHDIWDYRVRSDMRDDPNSLESLNQNGCSICKDLFAHMQRFFEMLEDAHRTSTSDWLTVEQIAEELKISKNVVYRLIRNGGREAINIVDTNDHIAKRGHYRGNGSDLKKYIAAKKVKVLSDQPNYIYRSEQFTEVRNHLGL